MTFKDSHSVTSSPGSVPGPTPCAEPGGPTTGLFGQVAAPASRSRRRVRGSAKTTPATSGPTSTGSSASAALPSCSESKSARRRDSDGCLAKTLTCKKCGTEKPYSEYYVNSKGNQRKTCKSCCCEQERRRKVKNREYHKTNYKEWRGKKRGHALCNVAKHRAKAKGLAFSLDKNDIQDRIDRGVCEMTGIPLNLENGRTWDSPSLDRIDSTKGYTMDNVRVVLYSMNVMANTWGANKIIEIAEAIKSKRMARSETLQNRLNESLKTRLSGVTSMEYSLTWKVLVTPAGRPILQRRALARRTSASDCFGWPSPTAAGFGCIDVDKMMARRARIAAKGINGNGFGLTLNQSVMTLAGWSTPSTRDHKDTPNMATTGTNPNGSTRLRCDQLPRQAGTTSASCDALNQLKNPDGSWRSGVGLKPEHSRWLMGLPPAWDDCAVMATPSSPKPPPSSSPPTSKPKEPTRD